jgi:hypothetical protein
MNVSYLLRPFVLFYYWFVQCVQSVRNHFREKEQRRQKRLYLAMRDSTVFFRDRFAQAFPGCRDVLIIDDSGEEVHRLDILLHKPLSMKVEDGGSVASPIWWFRGHQNLYIESYMRIKKTYFSLPRTSSLTA